MRKEQSPYAGKTIRVKLKKDAPNFPDEFEYIVEDWWINVAGKSWMFCDGNIACMLYGMRSGLGGLPTDNEVLYGKYNNLGILVHISEVAE